MFSKKQAFQHGIWLPFKLYFRPSEAYVLTRMELFKKLPLVVYLGSTVWVLSGFLVIVLLWGLPNITTVILSGVIAALLFLLGSVAGITHRYTTSQAYDSQGYALTKPVYAGLGFDFRVAISFGVVLATAAVILLGDLKAHHYADITKTTDNASILGTVLGITACLFASGKIGVKKFVIGGLVIGTGVTAFFAFASRAEVRQVNATAFAIATLLATHLIFQPVLFLIGLFSGPLARWNPGWAPLLWRISPARWDDFSYVPLPGLSGLVRALHSLDAAAGLQAANRLQYHPFYGRTGQRLYTEMAVPHQ
jgi:hypothetical protein